MLASIRRNHPQAVIVEDSSLECKKTKFVSTVTNYPGINIILCDLETSSDPTVSSFAGSLYRLDGFAPKEVVSFTHWLMDESAGLTPRLTSALFACLSDLSFQREQLNVMRSLKLTPRELEVLGHVARGRSNEEISGSLCVSRHTVRRHIHKILRKLKVRNRTEAVNLAYRKRWLLLTA
ncbi:MAG TPA: helix-turn-helix transcriptional regulator [Acidobacteriota bacterium]|nr:helix-turn-helix transcriptional regulator [Acidobacteriota bacterium]